jgi:hypothetical protein
MIDDKDGHIPSPLIMCVCTTLHRAILEWPKNQNVPLKDSKSKITVGRLDGSNYFNHKSDSSKIGCCCPAAWYKLLISPVVADIYTFLMKPEIHYWRAIIRGCIETVLLQSCVRSNRRSTQPLPRCSAEKQRMLIMLSFRTF